MTEAREKRDKRGQRIVEAWCLDFMGENIKMQPNSLSTNKAVYTISATSRWSLVMTFLDILGRFGTFWDNSEEFLTILDHLDSFKKNVRRTNGTTDGRTDRPS